MKTTTRCMVLMALITLAILALMAIPQEGVGIAELFALLVASKAVCAVCAVVAWRLYARWAGKLGFIDKLMQEEED